MEGIPTPERVPTKEEIIEELKLKGLTEETRAMVIKWTEYQEKEVRTSVDTILLNVQRIEFYEAVQDAEGAFDCAREAYENAYREGEFDICEKLEQRYPGVGV